MESVFFVKFMGLFMFLTGGTLLLSNENRMAIENVKNNESFLISMGYVNLLIGLPIVILHNVWALNILGFVNLMGWMMILKGIVFLAKPSIVKKKEYSEKNLKIRGLIGALIGLGLIYFGFYPC